jgi:hypothetical protein
MHSTPAPSTASCARAHASRGCRTWRDCANNAAERKPTPRKSLERDSLQPIEIPQNRQSFVWKSLEKNNRDLEKLGENARRCALVPPPCPLPKRRGRSRTGARRPVRFGRICPSRRRDGIRRPRVLRHISAGRQGAGLRLTSGASLNDMRRRRRPEATRPTREFRPRGGSP